LVSGDVQNSSCSIYADTFALAAATYESSSAGEEVKREVKSGASFAATLVIKSPWRREGEGKVEDA
jgi:hypothetical protein